MGDLKFFVRCTLWIFSIPIRMFFTFMLTICLPLAIPIWCVCWLIGWSKDENMYGLTPVGAAHDAYLAIWGKLT